MIRSFLCRVIKGNLNNYRILLIIISLYKILFLFTFFLPWENLCVAKIYAKVVNKYTSSVFLEVMSHITTGQSFIII